MRVKILTLLLLFLFCISCSEDKIDPMIDDPNANEKIEGSFDSDRTVLIYMAADNSLNTDSFNNMKEILRGALDNLNNGKLFVYYDRRNSTPKLIEIFQNKNRVETKVVKDYEEHNSASGEVLAQVIDDTFSRYNSKSKGLILWSHATAWLPKEEKLWNTRSFGDDQGEYMDIGELKESLKDDYFDFIIFDACLMSSVEVCYELRDKTKYIVGSANEILADGLPYENIIRYFFSDDSLENRLKLVCNSFYEYYSTDGEDGTAAISVIKTSGLDELALFCRSMLEMQSFSVLDMNIGQVQKVYYNEVRRPILYDFKDFFDQILAASDKEELEKLLKEIIVYERHTDRIYVSPLWGAPGFRRGLLPIERYCGLSSYIPTKEYDILNDWYLRLDWAQAIYSKPF